MDEVGTHLAHLAALLLHLGQSGRPKLVLPYWTTDVLLDEVGGYTTNRDAWCIEAHSDACCATAFSHLLQQAACSLQRLQQCLKSLPRCCSPCSRSHDDFRCPPGEQTP